MTPDKVEEALASLKQVSAAIACPDLPRRTRADESRWAATITEALSVLTEALAAKDAELACYHHIGCVDHGKIGELNLYESPEDLPDGAELYYFDNEAMPHDR